MIINIKKQHGMWYVNSDCASAIDKDLGLACLHVGQAIQLMQDSKPDIVAIEKKPDLMGILESQFEFYKNGGYCE